jgi:hypothetical protein
MIKRLAMTAVIVMFAAALAGFCAVPLAEAAPQPRVEVVFCLDTTGSMGGLIEGAKQKIWSIANQIVRGEPTPELHIGLVGYRDYGDNYVTRVFPLNDDLDGVYEDLMSFNADGGGDTPEHVNWALHDAVHAVSWSDDRDTLKLIFLVGDCPPHMDYDDGYDYRTICEEAVKRDIIINTVQCGDYPETSRVWRKIAKLGEGEYAAVAQEGGMTLIETPFDEELAMLNGMLEDTVVAFGSSARRMEYEERKESVKKMAPAAAAERAAYKSTDAGSGAYDLIDALNEGSVELEDLKDRQLPSEMRGMTKKERLDYLKKKEEERAKLRNRIAELSERRASYIGEKLADGAEDDSFDEVVQRFIEEQAEEKGIRY